MKVLREESYGDDGTIKSYDYDSLFTPTDAVAFIESMANDGYLISSTGVIYISEDSIRKQNKFFGSVEELKEKFPTIDWEDLDRISVAGENADEFFMGDIRPSIYGGSFFVSTYKKKGESTLAGTPETESPIEHEVKCK